MSTIDYISSSLYSISTPGCVRTYMRVRNNYTHTYT